MWYVMQVFTGKEENTKLQCEKLKALYPLAFERIIIPYAKNRMKYGNSWDMVKKILFPGYIFIVTDNLNECLKLIKKVEGLTKILGDGEVMIPLSKEEESLMLRLGGEEQVVEISEGIIEGTKVIITDGPLKGLETMIRKVDRHRRKAFIEVDMLGVRRMISVGLEIIRKQV